MLSQDIICKLLLFPTLSWSVLDSFNFCVFFYFVLYVEVLVTSWVIHVSLFILKYEETNSKLWTWGCYLSKVVNSLVKINFFSLRYPQKRVPMDLFLIWSYSIFPMSKITSLLLQDRVCGQGSCSSGIVRKKARVLLLFNHTHSSYCFKSYSSLPPSAKTLDFGETDVVVWLSSLLELKEKK